LPRRLAAKVSSSRQFIADQMRAINETRMHAVWKLGRLLVKVERQQVPGTGRGHKGTKSISRPGKSFLAFLAKLKLNKNRAQERERIGAMPRGSQVAPQWGRATYGAMVSSRSPNRGRRLSESGDFIGETTPAQPTRSDRLHHAS
jgi:hypothetical protein